MNQHRAPDDGAPNPTNANAVVSRTPPARHRVYSTALLLLATVQVAWSAAYFNTYVVLVQVGAVSALVGLMSMIFCALLYVGAMRFARSARNGQHLFLLAGAGLSFTISSWKLEHAWTYPLLMGALLGIAGWWLARRCAPVQPSA